MEQQITSQAPFTMGGEELPVAEAHNEPRAVEPDTFHLALTMAGAVSAGAYTAGVMDYLFEALDNFERARNGEFGEAIKALTPSHKVVVDAMGGASAGGMTTVMAALYALKGRINPVRTPGRMDEVKNNIFYDCWVLLDDDLGTGSKRRTTLQKALDTDDLRYRVRSLLNSRFIENIATRAIPDAGGDLNAEIDTMPAYISKDLEMLLSHAMLQGVPLAVKFDTENDDESRKAANEPGVPYHTTYEHFLVSHYKLSKSDKVEEQGYLKLDPYTKWRARQLRFATMATGAFPLGLDFRRFEPGHLNKTYLVTTIKRILTRDFSGKDPDERLKLALDAYKDEPVTVDGGTLNNEPYAEVLSVIRERFSCTTGDDEKAPTDGGHKRVGVIMIDPFPDTPDSSITTEPPKDIVDLVPQLFSTLRDQSKVKREEMVDQFRKNDHYRGQIYPAKRKVKDHDPRNPTYYKYPIACGSVFAFGGFLDMRFRQHDFFLGRNNARNFLRAYFSFPYHEKSADRNPIHRDARWDRGQEMFRRFVYTDRAGKEYLPILPDVNILLDGEPDSKQKREHYDIEDFPQYHPRGLFDLGPAMQDRVERMLELLRDRPAGPVVRPEEDNARDWMRHQYRSGFWARLGTVLLGSGLGLLFRLARGGMARKMVRSATGAVLSDLATMGLLEQRDPRKRK